MSGNTDRLQPRKVRKSHSAGAGSAYVVFQLAEVAVRHALFAAILRRIDRLRGPPMVTA